MVLTGEINELRKKAKALALVQHGVEQVNGLGPLAPYRTRLHISPRDVGVVGVVDAVYAGYVLKESCSPSMKRCIGESTHCTFRKDEDGNHGNHSDNIQPSEVESRFHAELRSSLQACQSRDIPVHRHGEEET